jgi:XTP/dITP diphosphohydrolase
MEIWIATTNKGKLKEFRALLNHIDGELIHDISEIPYYVPPNETGSSFEANALIKAHSLAAVKKGAWILADDSGLCVEGLDNLPGIHSARYAGPKATDYENIAKLLKMVSFKTPDNRKADFHCALVVISPEGKEHIFHGTMSGKIANKVQGNYGFGYDPVFVPEGQDCTFAQMLPKDKNKISHRTQCLRQAKLLFS